MRKYPLTNIYFYLTEGCNFSCRHCWIASGYGSQDTPPSVLNFDLFKKILQQAKPLGLSNVKLTGGEPLLHPAINEILEFIKRILKNKKGGCFGRFKC